MIIETTSIHGSEAPGLALRRPPSVVTLLFWVYLLAVIAAWLVLRQAGDRWWPATFALLAPRWPMALPLLVLWPWALGARHWGRIGLSAAATGVMALLVMGFRVSWPVVGERHAEARILTCNVHRAHVDAPKLAEYIASERPDVVALQDWSDANLAALFGDGQSGGWTVRREGQLLTASRFPIVDVTVLSFPGEEDAPPEERGAAAVFDLRTPKGVVHVINLHLASPHAALNVFLGGEAEGERLARNMERRVRESAIVRDAADRLDGPVVLVGDFNTTDDSPLFREWLEAYADAFDRRGFGFGYTYRIGRTQLRIDHVLVSPAVQVAECWVGPDVGSPHRPLVADLDCR